jgi:hypothetical protein
MKDEKKNALFLVPTQRFLIPAASVNRGEIRYDTESPTDGAYLGGNPWNGLTRKHQ